MKKITKKYKSKNTEDFEKMVEAFCVVKTHDNFQLYPDGGHLCTNKGLVPKKQTDKILRGELTREIWTCNRKETLQELESDIEEHFEYPCWGTIDLTKSEMRQITLENEKYDHLGGVFNQPDNPNKIISLNCQQFYKHFTMK